MIHQTTVTRHWDDKNHPFWWARCTCARWEIAVPSREKAQKKAQAHEQAAR